MGSVQIDLKTEREKKNISLDQIAADTNISLRYLQSIEEGRYGDLPGGLYNRAFIKAYCESINIDPEEILDRYDAAAGSFQPDTTLSPQIPTPPRKKTFSKSGPILIWTTMLLIAGVGIFFSRGWISDLFSPYFSEEPTAGISSEIPAEPSFDSPDMSAYPDDSSTGTLDAAVDSPETPVPEPVEDAGTVAETVSSIAEEAISPVEKKLLPSGKELPATAEADESNLRLEIAASEQCWISINRDDSTSIIQKMMEPGETEVFYASERMQVLIGNAGGIQMKINDMPTKPLGNRDQVIRMNIDLNNLQQFIDPSVG
jgi:cytoskeleton protein RodZ